MFLASTVDWKHSDCLRKQHTYNAPLTLNWRHTK